MSPPSFQSADMSAHSKAWTTRVAEKRKPEANATLAPRPRKQKTVGEAVLFFRSRRLNDVLSPAVPKQPVGEQFCRLRQNDRPAGCAPGLSPSAFVRLDHAALHTPNLCVMCQHVHTSVAPTKKCTKQPAHD